MDELLDRDPEPCDECTVELMLFVSFDGVRRCRPCTRIFADEHGWNLHNPPPYKYAKRPRKKKGAQTIGQERLL